ncbi:ABC transporter ATP-binding protein [Caldimonas tepidiphila]|uniref:ABC transporter ATP-binding protein n=1 Tax=Caldimonas tepidiphila TaxID=2315841 RepID=UPI001F0CAF18|nr:ABC transporter ATP-binding protein [Caldimonas tepidiphila]
MATPAPAGVLGLYRSVWRFADGVRARWLLATALLVSSTLVKLSMPWMAAQAINTLQAGGADASTQAALWIAAIVLAVVVSWSMHGPGRILERSVGVKVRQGVSDALYGKLTRVPLVWHDRHHSGELQQRVDQASNALGNFAQTQFIYLQNIVNLIGPVVALTLLSQLAGGMALAGYLAVAFVIIRFDRALMRLARRENDANRRYGAGLLDFIGNISTVMSLRLHKATRRLVGQRLDAVFEPLKRSIVLTEAKWCAVDLLTITLTWSLVVVYAWQSQNAGGTLMIGSLFMIYQYANQAGGVIGSMATNFQNFARMRTDYSSADPVWNAPEHPEATAAVGEEWRRIDVRDLHFSRDGAPEAGAADGEAAQRGGLHGVSLTLYRGERVALVGPSGSGKSTLMKVLAGLYQPDHGHFSVDGSARPGLKHLGSVTTLIPQEAEVFECTVRENLTFGERYDDSAIVEAAHVSAFDTVLATMPQGLDTPITERGVNMSGGQRQRLCLARGALAAQGSSVLMLDEPTSALDPVTEALVFRRLGECFPQACIVSSVHRMSLLEHFDKVVLMVAGRVLDVGSVPELMERQPIFREMVHGPGEAAALPAPQPVRETAGA